MVVSIIITRKGRKLLKYIQQACEYKRSTIKYSYLVDEIVYGKMTEREIQINLSDLHNEGLVFFRKVPEHDIPLDITLTYEGLRYFDWKFEEIKHFTLKSVITPILVAFITTMITMWVQNLFK